MRDLQNMVDNLEKEFIYLQNNPSTPLHQRVVFLDMLSVHESLRSDYDEKDKWRNKSKRKGSTRVEKTLMLQKSELAADGLMKTEITKRLVLVVHLFIGHSTIRSICKSNLILLYHRTGRKRIKSFSTTS